MATCCTVYVHVEPKTPMSAATVDGEKRSFETINVGDASLLISMADLARLKAVIDAHLLANGNANEAAWVAQNEAAVRVGA